MLLLVLLSSWFKALNSSFGLAEAGKAVAVN